MRIPSNFMSSLNSCFEGIYYLIQINAVSTRAKIKSSNPMSIVEKNKIPYQVVWQLKETHDHNQSRGEIWQSRRAVREWSVYLHGTVDLAVALETVRCESEADCSQRNTSDCLVLLLMFCVDELQLKTNGEYLIGFSYENDIFLKK